MRWQPTYKSGNFDWLILAALMVLKIVLQYLLIHPSYDLHRDEYLHLDQAKHLAWGYMSVPPLTSWVAWLISELGNDVFWVKFFPALFGAFTVFFAWKIVEELKGGLYAKVLVSLAVIFSVILRLNILFQPNSFEVLSWTAWYYFIVRFVNRRKYINLYIIALVLALAFLNKYNVLFPLAGIAVAWVLFPERKLLFNIHLLGAALFCLLLVMPNLLWQVENGIPFIHHMQTLAKTQLVNMSRTGFLKEQILLYLGSLHVLWFAFIGFLVYPAFRPYRFLVVGFLVTMVLYTWFRAKGYYAAGLYPVLLAFGAVYFERITVVGTRFWRWAGAGVVLILAVLLIRFGFPYMRAEKIVENPGSYRDLGLLRWEDGKDHHLPQDFADMLGWREMAYITDSAVNSLREKDGILILANNYGQAGAINFYSANHIEAVSFNADYLNWFPIGKPIKHVIRIMEIEDDDDDPGRTQERSLCDTLILAGEVKNALSREKGTRIWVMKNLTKDVWPIIIKEIEEHKK